jgi:hypothetical protein
MRSQLGKKRDEGKQEVTEAERLREKNKTHAKTRDRRRMGIPNAAGEGSDARVPITSHPNL